MCCVHILTSWYSWQVTIVIAFKIHLKSQVELQPHNLTQPRYFTIPVTSQPQHCYKISSSREDIFLQ